VATRGATRLTRTSSVRAGRDPSGREQTIPPTLPTATDPGPARTPAGQRAAARPGARAAAAVSARIDLLDTVNSAKALAMLNVGDRVRFNHHTRPQYLRGVEGVIIELDRDSASVCVHGPVGRFRSGTIHRCPPLILERLNPAA